MCLFISWGEFISLLVVSARALQKSQGFQVMGALPHDHEEGNSLAWWVKGHRAATFPPCVTSDQGSEDSMGKLLTSTPTGELAVVRGAGLCQQDAR